MKRYLIKYIDENGNVSTADNEVYEAESELDALHQFTDHRRNDLQLTKVEIVNDDPSDFILFLEGYVENKEAMRFDIYGDEFEYYAEEL